MVRRRRLEEAQGPGGIAFGQIPEVRMATGDIENARRFAERLFQFSGRQQDRLDQQVTQQAAVAGMLAGQDADFRPREEHTLAAQAYNRAALTSFTNELEIRARNHLDELYEEHRADPEGLQNAISAYSQGLENELRDQAPEVVADFRQIMERNARPLVRESRNEFLNVMQNEAQARVTEALETNRRSAERMAHIADVDEEAAVDLAAEREAYINKLMNYGPVQAFSVEGRELDADATRTAIFSPAEIQQAITNFDNQMYVGRVMGKFGRAADPVAYMNEFEADEKARRDSPLTFDEVDRVVARMRAEIKRGQTEARARRNELNELVRDAEFVLGKGKVPEGLEALAHAVAEFPDLSQRLGSAYEDRDIAYEFAQMTPAEQRTVVSALEQQPEMSRRQVELLGRLRSSHTETQTMLRQDPVAYANDVGLFALDPINLEEPETLQARGRASSALFAHYGIEHHGLTKAEVDQLDRWVGNLDTDGKISMMEMLRDGMGDRRLRSLMGEFAEDSPAFSIATSISAEAPELARNIVRGQAVIDSHESTQILPEPTRYMSIATEHLQDALFWSPEAQNAAIRAALAADAQQRFRQGRLQRDEFDERNFRKLLDEVVGGVITWNGQRIVAPDRGVTESRFRDMMRRMNDEDIAVGGVLPRDARGREIGMEDIRRFGRLESIGDGQYLIGMGNGYLIGEDGEPFELNLKGRADQVLTGPRDADFGRQIEQQRWIPPHERR